MPAGGKTPDADAVRSDPQFLRVRADVAQGALRILHHGRVMVAWREAVLQDECSDS